MSVCLCVDVCKSTCVYVHAEAEGAFLSQSPLHFFETRSLPKPGLH